VCARARARVIFYIYIEKYTEEVKRKVK